MKPVRLISLLVIIIIISVAAKKVLVSDVYNWEKLEIKKNSSGEVRDFFSSPAQTLENFQIKAITLYPGKDTKDYLVESGTDELLIIKEGTAEISVNKVPRTLSVGGIGVVFAGDNVAIKNTKDVNAVYYSIKFKPYKSGVQKQAEKVSSPVFVDWSTPVFVPSEIGGRRDFIKQPTSSLNELEIHVTTLKEGTSSHSTHSHPDEEIIVMRYGNAVMDINGKPYEAGPGSIYFLAGNDPHGIVNKGAVPCEYYAIRWLTNVPVKK